MAYNPEKISLLSLVAPLYFNSSSGDNVKYSMPDQLKETLVSVVSEDQRPLALINIIGGLFGPGGKPKSEFDIVDDEEQLREKKIGMVCFTNTKDTAQRLNVLLGFIPSINGVRLKCAEYSSSITAPEREAILKSFKNGDINLIICSDILSRGMDVPNIDVVINYNMPPTAVLYVHRVGRTARAGREGSSFTIVDKSEKPTFMGMMKKIGRKSPLKKHEWGSRDFKPLQKKFHAALKQTRLIYTKKRKSVSTKEEDSEAVIENLLEVNKKRAMMNFE
eukprot:gene16299-19386_t